jgi:hypothetical protein
MLLLLGLTSHSNPKPTPSAKPAQPMRETPNKTKKHFVLFSCHPQARLVSLSGDLTTCVSATRELLP